MNTMKHPLCSRSIFFIWQEWGYSHRTETSQFNSTHIETMLTSLIKHTNYIFIKKMDRILELKPKSRLFFWRDFKVTKVCDDISRNFKPSRLRSEVLSQISILTSLRPAATFLKLPPLFFSLKDCRGLVHPTFSDILCSTLWSLKKKQRFYYKNIDSYYIIHVLKS